MIFSGSLSFTVLYTSTKCHINLITQKCCAVFAFFFYETKRIAAFSFRAVAFLFMSVVFLFFKGTWAAFRFFYPTISDFYKIKGSCTVCMGIIKLKRTTKRSSSSDVPVVD
ncbi:hypothetical protein DM01DRAFT_183571 [Hesseltinella vesiculosa]|uniref:Uncharacterized protein n=1 Tax=Hesseltinella vesiculosa TaxID=101127 RepID=A0A1X2GKT8_9FUNG|nr:hypothetical protein DM01DRAFT_183571 [Hesseltinella vesiculosa]